MARTEARLAVSIWQDPEFLALGPMEQRGFMFLISQPDLAYTGVIALRERRWSQSAAGLNRDDVERDVKGLEAQRFVVVDWDREELLVRTLMRGDRVYKQPQILSVAREQLASVTSPIIRRALLAELEIIAGLEMVKASADIVAEMIATLRASLPDQTPASPVDPAPHPAPQGPEEGSAHPTDEPAEHPHGEWGVVTAVSRDIPTTHVPSPSPQLTLLPGGADAPEPVKPAKQPRPPADPTKNPDFMAWYGKTYPRREARPVAYKAYLNAVPSKITHDELMAKTGAWVADQTRRGRTVDYFPHPATWLNQERWGDEISAARASPPGRHQTYQNPTDPDAYYGDL